MGLTNNLGRLADALTADASLNVGVGATPDASYKLDAAGTGRFQDNLLVSNNRNAVTTLTISNTTSGIASQAQLISTSDSTSGSLAIGKYSTATTVNKIIAAKDAYFYNNTVAGDIAILNDFATGQIKLAAGGSSTAHVTIASTGATTFSNTVTASSIIKSGGTAVQILAANGTVITAGTNITISGATISSSNATITLSGDVSGSGTTAITTAIGANKVTNAMLAQVATATFKGRVTAATGNVEDLSATQATSLLNVFSSTLKGLSPASGGGTTNFLRADGTWAAPSFSSTNIYNTDGTLTGNRTVTLSTFSLTFVGGLFVSKNQNLSTNIEISNTNTTTSAFSELILKASASNFTRIGKCSTTSSINAVIGANDTFIRHFADGNLVLECANPSGSIILSSGNTGVAQSTLKFNGQLQLNNYTSSSAFTGTSVSILAVDASGNVITTSSSSVFSELDVYLIKETYK